MSTLQILGLGLLAGIILEVLSIAVTIDKEDDDEIPD